MSSAPSTPVSRRYMTPSSRSRQSLTPSLEEGSHTPPPASDRTPQKARTRHVAVPLDPSQSLRAAHPKAKLERLLHDIQDPGNPQHARYGPFVSSEGDDLPKFLERCVRDDVWALVAKAHAASSSLESDELAGNIDGIKGLGGDLRYYGRAIYLHIVEFADGIVRLYVGQAWNLSSRVNRQHVDFRYRRDHPSLHNFAVDRSTADSFVVLATLRERTEEPALVLNLLEMWMALCYDALPAETMDAWLGPPVDEGTSRKKAMGLNVASPLDNGNEQASRMAFQMLKDSKDPMAKDYYWDVRKRPRAVVRASEPVVASQLGVFLVGFGAGAAVVCLLLLKPGGLLRK